MRVLRGGKPHNNCDGCARGLPVVNGLHIDNGKGICGCTAHLYAITTFRRPKRG